MSCKGLIYAGLMMIMSVFITSNAQAKIVTPSALFNTAINQNVTEENATPDVTLVGRRHHYRRHYRYRHRGYRHRGYRRYGYRRHYGYGHRYPLSSPRLSPSQIWPPLLSQTSLRLSVLFISRRFPVLRRLWIWQILIL